MDPFFPALLLVNVFCHSNKTKLEYLGTGSGTRDGDNDNCAEKNSEKHSRDKSSGLRD